MACGAGLAEAQFPTPRVFAGAPAAPWIFPPGAGNEFGVFHFRRVFELDARPSSFVVHVSADNRYRLFVNGKQVSSGPQRSDLMHWRYETVDLASHLRAGRNVLAAIVWNWGAERPVAQFSRQTAFLLQGNSPREAVVNSGPEWRVLRNEGYSPIPVLGSAVGGYFASPPGEAIDARRYPWGWEQLDFSEDGWGAAAAGDGFRARRTQLRASNPFGEAGGWQLVARSIPPMEESPIRFATVRRSEGIAHDDGFLRGTRDAVVPAKTRAVLLLDQAHLTNAFAVLETSGGAGSTVALVYAEALKDKQGNKGNRNEIEGKTIAGVRDEFRPDGGERRRFQTLWFRTYRYVQLEIETGARRPVRQRPRLARAHVGDQLARRAALCLGDLFRHSVLRAAPVRGRHTHPGTDYALHERRRSARAPGDRALRPLADPGGDHRQSLPLRPRAVHSDLLADLGRDGARLLDAP
jgi:hypothetical protein